MYLEHLMNLQEDACSSKEKKVNTLANRSEVDVSCYIDTERVENWMTLRKTGQRFF